MHRLTKFGLLPSILFAVYTLFKLSLYIIDVIFTISTSHAPSAIYTISAIFVIYAISAIFSISAIDPIDAIDAIYVSHCNVR